MSGAVKLLVADGDGLFRERLVSAAARRGVVRVGEAADGAGALEQLARERPEIFITDIPLRRVDGLTLIGEALGGGEGRIVCAVATAVRDPAVAAAARKLGAVLLAYKPCRPDALLDAALRAYFTPPPAGPAAPRAMGVPALYRGTSGHGAG